MNISDETIENGSLIQLSSTLQEDYEEFYTQYHGSNKKSSISSWTNQTVQACDFDIVNA